jgi:hypothetical protein
MGVYAFDAEGWGQGKVEPWVELPFGIVVFSTAVVCHFDVEET